MKKYNVAILGATGAVGQEFLNLIEERSFPFASLKMLASKRSAGKKIQFMGKEYTVEETTEDSFKDVEIALFAGGAASKQFAPAADYQELTRLLNEKEEAEAVLMDLMEQWDAAQE